MIDEDELRALLSDAAESVPPPGRAPQALLDAIAEQADAPTRHRPRRLTLVAAAAAVVAVAAIGLSVASVPSTDDSESSGEATDGGAASGDEAVPGFTAGSAAGSATAGGDASGGGGTGGEALAPTATPDAAAPPAALDAADAGGTVAVGQPTDTAKVIRTGSLDLEVEEGAFQSTVERITSQTIGLGGYIAEATTSESSESPSGSITVRVPGESFDQLLSDLRELGDVKAVTSKGTDVTAQFTDLQARLNALTATRDRLNVVLAEADTVPDILAVQDRITGIQTQIEQLQGQQKLLEDQTAFGTLAITLGEPGAEIIEPERAGDGGLGGAWDDARRRFGDNVETIVSWSGSAAVALAIGLAGLLVFRFVWVAMRRRLV